MVVLREPNEYPVVLALVSEDGRIVTRLDIGLVAKWMDNELVIPLDQDDASEHFQDIAETIRREAP